MGQNGALEALRDMETGQVASRAMPVPGAMVEQGSQAAMEDQVIRAAMADQGPPCLFVGVCGLEFARPHALLSKCVLLCYTQFMFLSAACIHVISCAVWHAACVFHVVMSCVNTWLMSFLISCVFVSCFAHGW